MNPDQSSGEGLQIGSYRVKLDQESVRDLGLLILAIGIIAFLPAALGFTIFAAGGSIPKVLVGGPAQVSTVVNMWTGGVIGFFVFFSAFWVIEHLYSELKSLVNWLFEIEEVDDAAE